MQEHEQALISAIARLADASDFESGNKQLTKRPILCHYTSLQDH